MRKDWEVKKLGDVCEIFDSLRKPITKSKRISGNYPYYGASGVQDYIDSFIFDGRYLLVGEDGAKWGKKETSSYIIEGKSWVNNHVHVLKLNEYLIDSFVEYYLNYSDLNKYITGAVVPKLTQRALQSIIIPVPPFQTQYQIVEELDCLTSIIEKQKKQLEELDNLAQAIFYDMFGDPIENEKGWNIKTLNELCIKITDGEHIRPLVVKEGIPFLSAKDITNGFVDFSDPLYVSEDFAKKSRERCNPEFGDILVISRGATIGKACIIKTHKKFCLLGSVILLKYQETINGIYLLYYLKTPSINSIMKGLCGALAQPAIYLKDIKKLDILVPPLPLQQQFASKVEAIEKQKELIKKSIKETEDLFNSRMDYYFN